jgi:hypothetical protein
MLYVQMAVCQLVLMKQAEVLLKPVRFELPADFQLAIHNAKYDASRLNKQKIKVDDLPVRQSGERSVSRLMQTYVLLLQASISYRSAVEGQQIYASAVRHKFLSDGDRSAERHKAQKHAPARPSLGLNGAARFTHTSKAPLNSNKIQKTNGRASS